jgi:predicted ATPase
MVSIVLCLNELSFTQNVMTGVPGSGKTSLVHALASSCDLDIYVVSLATAG